MTIKRYKYCVPGFRVPGFLSPDSLKDTRKDISMGAGGNYGGTTIGASANYGGSESEQATRATIGQGTVTVKDGSEVTANRDLDKAQEVTMEHTIGGLNANLTVDTRMFSEQGRKQIKTDFADTYLHAGEIAQSVKDVATNDDVGITDFGKQVNTYATKRETEKQMAADAALHEKLQGKEGAEGNQEGLQAVVDGYNEAQGVEDSAEVNLYDGSQTPDDTAVMSTSDFNKEESNSGYHAEENDIYVNVDNVNMTDSGEQVEAASHEQARNRMAAEGSTLSEQTQTNLATAEGQQSRQAFELYSGINGYETSSTPEAGSMWKVMNQGSTTVQAGTEKMQGVNSQEVEPWIVPPQVIVGGSAFVVGAGIAAYQNWDKEGSDFWSRVGLGGATMAASVFGRGIKGSAALGGGTAALNEAGNQAIDIQQGHRTEFDKGKIGEAGALGIVTAPIGYEVAKGGSMIGVISKDYSKTHTLEAAGGITGNTAGTLLPEIGEE